MWAGEGGEGGGEDGGDEVAAAGGGEAVHGEREERTVGEEGWVREARKEQGGKRVRGGGGVADGGLEAGQVGRGGGSRWGDELGLRGEEADEEVAAAQQGGAPVEGGGGGGHGGRGEARREVERKKKRRMGEEGFRMSATVPMYHSLYLKLFLYLVSFLNTNFHNYSL